MSEVINIDEHRPMTPIYEITVYRKNDGKLCASLVWADTDWIESNGSSVSERMEIIANDMPELEANLKEQSLSLSCEPDDMDSRVET